jgi:hypothetical protein
LSKRPERVGVAFYCPWENAVCGGFPHGGILVRGKISTYTGSVGRIRCESSVYYYQHTPAPFHTLQYTTEKQKSQPFFLFFLGVDKVVLYTVLQGRRPKMAKAQMVLLNIITAIFIAVLFVARKPFMTDDIAVAIALLLFLLIVALVVIFIVSIFRVPKLVTQKDEEKLKKSAIMVKLSAIPLWIIILILLFNFNFWYFYETIILDLSLLVPLWGTSIFSISYIRVLYKKKKLSLRQTVIYTVLQFCFVLDIISFLYLRYTKTNKRGAKNKKNVNDAALGFLGSFKPAAFAFAGTAINAFKQGPVPRIAEKIGAFFVYQLRNRLFRLCVIIAILCMVPAVPAAYSFYQSRKPQPVHVGFTIQVPDATGNPHARPPLAVSFKRPVATQKTKDKEVPAGRITIDPPIAGVWQWQGNNRLVFSAERDWQAGKRYTVTFPKNFFPSPFIVNNSFHFNIEKFSLRIIEKEFYIDDDDGAIKRVLFTVQANYPIYPSSLETHISIEPNISADSGSLKKQPYLFSVTYNEDRTRARIVSEPLGIPAKEAQMRLSIAEGVRDLSGAGNAARRESASIAIPGMTGFARIMDIRCELVKNERQAYETILMVTTRGTVDSGTFAQNISAWALPIQGNYQWGDLNEITARVLALSRRINFENTSVNGWRFRAEGGQYVYVRINSGAPFHGGYILDAPYETIMRVPFPPQEVTLR